MLSRSSTEFLPLHISATAIACVHYIFHLTRGLSDQVLGEDSGQRITSFKHLRTLGTSSRSARLKASLAFSAMFSGSL
jgi:hypothetical protein